MAFKTELPGDFRPCSEEKTKIREYKRGMTIALNWITLRRLGNPPISNEETVTYLGKNKQTGKKAVLKVNKITSAGLSNEADILLTLKDNMFFPRMIEAHLNMSSNYLNILAMEFEGPNLEILKTSCKKFSLETTVVIGDQMWKAIQALHSIGYAHGYIKPSSFVWSPHRRSVLLVNLDRSIKLKRRSKIGKTRILAASKQSEALAAVRYLATARKMAHNSHEAAIYEKTVLEDFLGVLYVIFYCRSVNLKWSKFQCRGKPRRLARRDFAAYITRCLCPDFSEIPSILEQMKYASINIYEMLSNCFEAVKRKLTVSSMSRLDWECFTLLNTREEVINEIMDLGLKEEGVEKRPKTAPLEEKAPTRHKRTRNCTTLVSATRSESEVVSTYKINSAVPEPSSLYVTIPYESPKSSFSRFTKSPSLSNLPAKGKQTRKSPGVGNTNTFFSPVKFLVPLNNNQFTGDYILLKKKPRPKPAPQNKPANLSKKQSTRSQKSNPRVRKRPRVIKFSPLPGRRLQECRHTFVPASLKEKARLDLYIPPVASTIVDLSKDFEVPTEESNLARIRDSLEKLVGHLDAPSDKDYSQKSVDGMDSVIDDVDQEYVPEASATNIVADILEEIVANVKKEETTSKPRTKCKVNRLTKGPKSVKTLSEKRQFLVNCKGKITGDLVSLERKTATTRIIKRPVRGIANPAGRMMPQLQVVTHSTVYVGPNHPKRVSLIPRIVRSWIKTRHQPLQKLKTPPFESKGTHTSKIQRRYVSKQMKVTPKKKDQSGEGQCDPVKKSTVVKETGGVVHPKLIEELLSIMMKKPRWFLKGSPKSPTENKATVTAEQGTSSTAVSHAKSILDTITEQTESVV